MILTAHRGESYIAPENTLAAFELAWKLGADALELDVHASADGRIMVMHDGATLRTCGKHLVIKETHSSELRKLDAGRWKGEEFAGEKIPFLEEALDILPPGKDLLMEIKCGPEALPTIRDILDASGKRSQVLSIGFNLEVMIQSKKLMPDVETALIRSCFRDQVTLQRIPYTHELIKVTRDAGLECLNIEYHTLTQEYADAVRAAGLKLWSWTTNDPAVARRQIELGSLRLGTDRRKWMSEELAEIG